MTHTETINAIIAAGAPMTIEQIVQTELDAWIRSPRRGQMIEAQRYYETQNDILSQCRQMIGPGGQQAPAKNVADNHIAHGFVPELIDQKVQYLLGKPWSLDCDEAAAALLGPEFQRLVARTARDAVCKGIGWLQVYIDDAGSFGVKRVDPVEVLPFWRDLEHEQLDAVIRCCPVEVYEGRQKRIVEKVEFWSLSGVTYFERRDGLLRPDPERTGGPMLEGEDGPYNWARLPFIALKYNDREQPLLAKIKTLVDEYDRVVTGDSNMLEDQPNDILVLHNYDGTDLGEFRQNLNAFRAVKVSDNGGVESVTIRADVEASTKHLEQIRRDIYAFGRGVDTRNERLTGATSGQALRFEYAQLDMDCNQLELGVQDAVNGVLWFAADYLGRAPEEAGLTLNRDIIINEEGAVAMCAQSKGVISDETILANHPWVEDAKEELARLKQQQDDLEWQAEGFPGDETGGGTGGA